MACVLIYSLVCSYRLLGRIDRWHNLKSAPKIIVLKTNNKSEIGAVRTITPEKVNSKIKNFNDVSKKYISYLETTFENNAKLTIGDIYRATSNFETDNKELLFDFYKEIKKESDEILKKTQYSYNRNKKAIKKWNDIKIYEYLTAKAKVSDSPIRIPYGLYHDSELGLINRNN